MDIIPKLEKAISNLYSLQVAPTRQDVEFTFDAIHLIQEAIKGIKAERAKDIKELRKC